jgi:hypothetical protein
MMIHRRKLRFEHIGDDFEDDKATYTHDNAMAVIGMITRISSIYYIIYHVKGFAIRATLTSRRQLAPFLNE